MWTQESRGKLRLYERYADLDGNNHKVSVPLASNSARDYKEAVSKLMLKMAEQEHNGDEIRLNDLMEKYINREDIKESTRLNYICFSRKLNEIFGNPYISAIDNAMVKRKLSDCDLSIKRKNAAIKLIKSLCRFAQEYGYNAGSITIRPFKETAKPRNIEDEYLTSEELQNILDKLYGVDYYFTKFLALTGCRFGEAAALLISDYHDGYITISKTGWHGRAQTAKTATSNRDIYAQAELRKLMAEYLPFRKTLMIARGVRTDLLFFNRNGNMIQHPSYTVLLHSLEDNKHLHAHIFRHTHASLLAEAGYSLESISRRLGHADSDITKKIYLHVTEKMKQKEEAQLDAIRLID